MDKALPRVGNTRANKGLSFQSKFQPSVFKSKQASRSSLAADMLKAQQDLAAAAGGHKVPVDDGDDQLPAVPKKPTSRDNRNTDLGSAQKIGDQPPVDDLPPTPAPAPPASSPKQPSPIEPGEKSEEVAPVSGLKEQRELGPVTEPEKTPVTEYKEPEPGPEVKDWMEKLEEGETIQLPQPVTDDYGQVLVQAAGKPKPKIVLPLDEEELSQGLHQKVVNSMRWLAEWCVRVMKKAAGRVFYKPTEEKA